MKLVYFGTSGFAVPALQRIAPHVCLVVTQPDKPVGRKMVLTPSPVKVVAMELGIPVETPVKARAPEFVEQIEALGADALIVASYGQILSERLLNAARIGGVNLHGSLLPKYRGAAPIQRAIENGDPITGTTLMQMAKGMDTGDEIARVETPIGPDETYGELHDRLAILSADLLEEWLPRLVAGDYPRKEQDHDNATHAAKITREDSELFFTNPASQEYNRLRARLPNPGAYIQTSLGLLKIHQARLGTGEGEPGQILSIENGLEVAFQSGSMTWHEVQPEGKKRLSAAEFVNGARLKPGDSLFPVNLPG